MFITEYLKYLLTIIIVSCSSKYLEKYFSDSIYIHQNNVKGWRRILNKGGIIYFEEWIIY